MNRLLAVAIAAVCAAGIAFAQVPPGPGQPFGGDDAGCEPDTSNHLKCADGLARAFARLMSDVTRCHQRQVTARLSHKVFDEESCENATPFSNGHSAAERFDTKVARLVFFCRPDQVSAANAERDELLAGDGNPESLDALNGSVYCDSTSGAMVDDSPSPDDAGWVPANGAIDRCERTVGRNLATLAMRVIRCHTLLADKSFKGQVFDEEACEDTGGRSGLDRYNIAADRLTARGICPLCQSNAVQRTLGVSMVQRWDAGNGNVYHCTGPTTTTTITTTTTTTLPGGCACAGGTPSRLIFTTAIGSGNCGHLDADGNPNFFSINCGGLYFGGAGVGVPLPSIIPDMGKSIIKAVCSGTTLTLSNSTSTETGSIRTCTSTDCFFGPPLPIPNVSHSGAATSTCIVNTVSSNATGTADCNSGSTTNLSLPLSAGLFLTADLLANRCSGGSTPGASCTPAGSACPGGGTCVNDTGRCTNNGNACVADTDCSPGTCETGACVAGANAGKGCIANSSCPGSTCRTFIQPCPICNATTLKCNGGPNDGLACTPGDTGIDGDYPTSHDCPPSPGQGLGALPIAFLLDSGTKTKTSVDLPAQVNVFCGFCRNKITNVFRNPAVICTTDADCAGGAGGTTSCGQRTSGAFTADDVARTITLNGAPAGVLTTGGAAKPSKIVSIFCIPPTFNPLVDSAADLPGPGAVALDGVTQLLP